MVCLDPERESDGREKRWCWGEVMRQLLYRYELFTVSLRELW
jgi:breast cancer 2 susceptibility protein